MFAMEQEFIHEPIMSSVIGSQAWTKAVVSLALRHRSRLIAAGFGLDRVRDETVERRAASTCGHAKTRQRSC